MILFVVLPFAGFWLGMQYGHPQTVVYVETTNTTPVLETTSDVETEQYAPETKKILAAYLSPYKNSVYSGLEDNEIDKINRITSLAQKQTSYTKEEIETAKDFYNELFLESMYERVEDAPSFRTNEILRTKVCIAVSIISNEKSEVVEDCTGEDMFPSDIEWSTDDLTAVAQIIPYYLAGSHYFNLDSGTDLSRYYFKQVLLHQEAAENQWGQEYFEQVAGDDYIKMVEDARVKLELLNE